MGGDAEEWTAEELEALDRRVWRVFHDVPVRYGGSGGDPTATPSRARKFGAQSRLDGTARVGCLQMHLAGEDVEVAQRFTAR